MPACTVALVSAESKEKIGGPQKSLVLTGRADYVAENGDVWEFKCADEARAEHLLQLACYLAMSYAARGHLFAILGCEITTISVREPAEFLRTVLARPPDPTNDILDAIAEFDAKTPRGTADDTAADDLADLLI